MGSTSGDPGRPPARATELLGEEVEELGELEEEEEELVVVEGYLEDLEAAKLPEQPESL